MLSKYFFKQNSAPEGSPEIIEFMINLRFKLSALALSLALLFFPVDVHASAMGPISVSFRSISFNAGDSGYSFALKFNPNQDLVELSLNWKGHDSVYKKDILGNVKSAIPNEIKVRSVYAHAQGTQNEIFVFIPFNIKRDPTGKEGESVHDVLRLHFLDGKLVEWAKAEFIGMSDKEPKMRRWKLTAGDLKLGEVEPGEIISQANPYD